MENIVVYSRSTVKEPATDEQPVRWLGCNHSLADASGCQCVTAAVRRWKRQIQ